MSVNVNREVSDDFYRYKMPRLIAKVEGKGNGIKTVIVNMQEIGKALCRPPIYPTKFFGAELGAQIQFDQKNDRYIVNGAHEAERLQTILDGFIRKYVLCSHCENPETDLIVKSRGKQGELSAKCKACGAIAGIIDNSRTTQFIVKNPPDETGLGLATGGGKTKSKRDRGDRTAKSDKSPEHEVAEETNGTAEPEVDDAEDDNGSFDSEEWEESSAPIEELPDSVKRLIVTDELELTPQDRANRFHSFLTEKLKSGLNAKSPTQLVLEAERLDIREKAVIVVVEVLLTNPAKLVSDITKNYRSVFIAFTGGSVKSQKYLLGAVESLVVRFRDTLLNSKKIPNLLNAFYNADILSEAALLEWDAKGPSKRHTGDKKLSKTIHEYAQPFITWLKTAEEESSEEEEEEETEAVISQPKPVQSINGTGTQSKTVAANNKEGGDSDSDIDIDDI